MRWSPKPGTSLAIRHDIKGQGIYAYVTFDDRGRTKRGAPPPISSPGCARISGPIASPDIIHFAAGLAQRPVPGKIMRRILRKIAERDSRPSVIFRLWPIPLC